MTPRRQIHAHRSHMLCHPNVPEFCGLDLDYGTISLIGPTHKPIRLAKIQHKRPTMQRKGRCGRSEAILFQSIPRFPLFSVIIPVFPSESKPGQDLKINSQLTSNQPCRVADYQIFKATRRVTLDYAQLIKYLTKTPLIANQSTSQSQYGTNKTKRISSDRFIFRATESRCSPQAIPPKGIIDQCLQRLMVAKTFW